MNADAYRYFLHYHFSENRKIISGHWVKNEQNIRHYLEKLQDKMLTQEIFTKGEPKDFILRQVVPFRMGYPEQRAMLAERRLC
jgi:hypothetical protein